VNDGFCCSAAMQCDSWLQPLHGLPDFQDVLNEVLHREASARTAFQTAGGNQLLP